MVGYDVPEIRDAVPARQLATGVVHTSTLYLIRGQVELAEKLARLSGIPGAKVFLTNSGTEANETALMLWPRPPAGRTRYWRWATATTAARSARSRLPGTAGGRAPRWPRSACITCTARTGSCRPSRAWTTRGTPPLRGRPAARAGHRHRRRRGLPDRRAHPGRRRVHHAAGRAARRVRRGAARARRADHFRRGADRMGPDRGAFLGHRRARRGPGHHHVRQGPGQRPGDRRGDRPRRPDGRAARQRHLHLRRQPAVHRRGQRPPSTTCSATTCSATRPSSAP